MPRLCDIQLCCGCAACYSACQRNAIEMVEDQDGFLYPKVSESKCIGCNRCQAVCPVLVPYKAVSPKAVLASKAIDTALRDASSSGGIFSLLAMSVIRSGGLVIGAAVDADGNIKHIKVGDCEELCRLRGSKYVQSQTGEMFRFAKSELESGKQVLYSGTPCQISGLKHFLGKEYDNLLCVDVVCHAIPSPKSWRSYIGWSECDTTGHYKDVSFRDKRLGWRRYSMKIVTKAGKTYCQSHEHDPFLKAFGMELLSRSSCYHCPARNMKSGADVTLGDFWQVWEINPALYDEHGVSLVMLNTSKGVAAYSHIRHEIRDVETDFNIATKINSCIIKDPIINSKREQFFYMLNKGIPFGTIVKRLSHRSLFSRVLARIRPNFN